ncbi:cytochrome P450 [Bacillus thuringiensis serovar shandongiensis]|uniref:cytochrome P450 n=1 Tax=Bacillus cereus group TaxID=86661 RepID=UPI000B45313A|nr:MULTISPECIES: cytochrome P450 [Bacillus cereus group]OTX39821.1 cytochrome P450 [Bacillus thuringiensis serovar malayensis]OUB01658.1 cytochrome P450 [Bacillus thuringiensis serovar shandongiensis]MBJ8096684.1 cytochrome P450 [Bacillus cereus group sp. N11]PDY88515.1 cytochrome P450 [Bacillus toyonensis]HDX9657001.1 cytochrome P450 [Bacillus toyonensis]
MDSPENVILVHEISKLKTKEELWNPYGWYQFMRDNHQVHYDEEQDVWNVFLYEDVNRVLSDYRLFSSRRERRQFAIPPLETRININSTDPPEHRNVRSIVSKAFTPRSLEQWKPRIQAIADELVKNIKKYDEVNIVNQFAAPLPVTVISDLLGVPTTDRKQIKEWSDILFMPYSKERFNDLDAEKGIALNEFKAYLLPIVQEKRYHLTDDIISDLIRAEYEGERLTDEEIVTFSLGLLAAGNETTTNLIINSFYCFLVDSPGIYQELREEPKLVAKAIEEVLRYRFPVTLARRITEDTNIFGPLMKKDQMIVAWVSAANLDENKFSHASKYNLHRIGNEKHLTFGKGPHFCLGAPLARLEAEIALSTFINAFEKIELSPSFNLERCILKNEQTLKYLPIRLKTQ